MRWVMGNVKLLLEWVTVPIFIIALQLPQGAVLYWLASSLTALAQVGTTSSVTVQAATGSLFCLDVCTNLIRGMPHIGQEQLQLRSMAVCYMCTNLGLVCSSLCAVRWGIHKGLVGV